ncbi:acyl-[acyl-carrier-protein] thioesterase [Clostridium thermobutyricum]|uniref:acyl-[acyl-carrier-protein] thioesterase n=1 Tax=Clostridium thermobutyricum TaxID=29372 RepID=UPI00258EE828|nr:acyl-ACP thioesterase domain-containing protein [uncultured Clostridium sp.]
MDNSFTKDYEVLYRDVDYKLRCKIASLVYFLCDVGNAHAESVGDTINYQLEHGAGWVFYKYDIKIHKYPNYRDKLSVVTIPAGFKKFYALRDYLIKNQDGEVLVEATALFFLINIERRRPMRILPEHYKMYGEDGDLEKAKEMEKIEKMEEEQFSKEFQIRYSDIDSNTHVNNVKYVEWALESVPKDIIKEFDLKRIKIVFEKEVSYGNSIHVGVQVKEEEDGTKKTLHKIYNKEGVELTLLEFQWEKK